MTLLHLATNSCWPRLPCHQKSRNPTSWHCSQSTKDYSTYWSLTNNNPISWHCLSWRYIDLVHHVSKNSSNPTFGCCNPSTRDDSICWSQKPNTMVYFTWWPTYVDLVHHVTQILVTQHLGIAINQLISYMTQYLWHHIIS